MQEEGEWHSDDLDDGEKDARQDLLNLCREIAEAVQVARDNRVAIQSMKSVFCAFRDEQRQPSKVKKDGKDKKLDN